MKFLPIAILVTVLIAGCKQNDPLNFISVYHAYAEQCSDSIAQHNDNDGSKSVVEKSCQALLQQAKSFEKELNSLTSNSALALEKSESHRAMLSNIMEVGFKYSALNSPAEEKVVVLSSPNIIRVKADTK